MVPNSFQGLEGERKVLCPRCGRKGYKVIKYVTGPTHFRLYACLYVKHSSGRPRWCYIKRVKELDPSPNEWW